MGFDHSICMHKKKISLIPLPDLEAGLHVGDKEVDVAGLCVLVGRGNARVPTCVPHIINQSTCGNVCVPTLEPHPIIHLT